MAANSLLSATQTYGLSPKRRWLMLGPVVAMLALPVVLAVADPKAGPAVGIVLLPAMSPALAILSFFSWFPKLTVSAEGMRFRGALAFSTVFVPWSNLERVRLKALAEGLILREPLTGRAAASFKNWAGMRYRGASFFDAEQQMYILQQRYVPIQSFAYWFRHGALLEQIRQYAPWLADDLKSQELPYEESKIRERRKLVWIFVISGVISLIAAAIALLNPELPAKQQAIVNHGATAASHVASWCLGLGLAAYAFYNLLAAWKFAGRKQYGYAAMWLLMAIFQLLFLLMVIFPSK